MSVQEPVSSASSPGSLSMDAATETVAHLETLDAVAEQGPRSTRWGARKYIIVIFVSLVNMLDTINMTSVTIALPSILKGVGFHPHQLQCDYLDRCTSAYGLSYAALQLIGGRLGNQFGQKRIFLLGVSWFACWSTVCGWTRDPALLSIARAMEGVGTGLIVPSALALLRENFCQDPERRTALKIFNGMGIYSQNFCILLGGVFSATVGWQWIFYTTTVLSALVSIVGYFFIPADKPREGRPSLINAVRTVVCLLIGITTVVYCLIESTVAGWSSTRTLIPLVIGMTSLIGAVLLESNTSHRLVPTHIWKSRRFTGSILIVFCVTATYHVMFFYLTITFQTVNHYTPLTAACSFFDHGAGLSLGLYIVSRLSTLTRIKGIMIVGWVLIIVSSVLLAQIQAGSSYWEWAFPALVINCLGLGPTWMCCQLCAVSIKDGRDVIEEDQEIKEAVYNAAVQLGGPVGLAIANIVAAAIAETPPGTASVTGSVDGQEDLMMKGYSAAFYTFGVMAGIGLILTILFMPGDDSVLKDSGMLNLDAEGKNEPSTPSGQDLIPRKQFKEMIEKVY
ncbi:hypothetical protein BGZ83_007144 [Gryganskiella cystojenkinii]|nr:hypothetical protein BGZ83_007144 [Gryganskiella cystojenkinii]